MVISMMEYISTYIQGTDSVSMKAFIEENFDFIVDNSNVGDDLSSVWSHRVISISRNMNKKVVKSKPDWGQVALSILKREQKPLQLNDLLEKYDPPTAKLSTNMANDITPVTGSTTSSSITATKLSLHLSDKRRVQAVFDQLDRSKLWYLKATIQLSQADNSEVLSVEEKILNFALKCNYIHPCHSFILDLNDENWREVFTKEELQEIHSDGPSTIRHIDRRMEAELDRLEGKICLKEIYNHSRAIEHDLEKEPLIGWLSTSVTSLSSLFFNEVNNIDNYMESDRMYRLWFFLNTIFDNSPINAIGKEKSSVSNSMARNSKRKISAVEEMPNRRIGRKVDTVYSNGIFEFGAHCTKESYYAKQGPCCRVYYKW
ncbi:hypothetical protein BDB01DRAFT_898280 [Pilobolus umbonatus]|nr:hypothetical protein BDB01DRAFT_898280 [Pilobolus umbonatus]